MSTSVFINFNQGAVNPFNQSLNSGDTPTFSDVTTTDDAFVGDDLTVTHDATISHQLNVVGPISLTLFTPTAAQGRKMLVIDANGLVAAAPPLTSNSSNLFANLPTNPAQGTLAYVADSTTDVWGAQVAGGGALGVLAWFSVNKWLVIGKS